MLWFAPSLSWLADLNFGNRKKSRLTRERSRNLKSPISAIRAVWSHLLSVTTSFATWTSMACWPSQICCSYQPLYVNHLSDFRSSCKFVVQCLFWSPLQAPLWRVSWPSISVRLKREVAGEKPHSMALGMALFEIYWWEIMSKLRLVCIAYYVHPVPELSPGPSF